MQGVRWNSGFMQDAHGLGSDEWRLLRRFRHHGIAGHQRGGDLTEKDRERKIPGADADEHAASAVAKLVRLARRARQRSRGKRAPCLERVITAEIDRLAHLCERVVERFAVVLGD